MPRISRGLTDGFIYHILNRGNGKQPVFHKDADYEAFLSLIGDAMEKYPVKLFFYCLMPNHFHMVLSPVSSADLSKWMQWLMTAHVRRYHTHYRTCGHVWQGRFKSFIIQHDNYLLAVGRYVEANPVRAGLVESAKDWPWSSHQLTLSKSENNLLSASPIEFSGNWSQYVDMPQTEIELEKLRESSNRQSPYGNTDWQEKISQELHLESTIRPRGRPRKERKK
jgi:putative transposase